MFSQTGRWTRVSQSPKCREPRHDPPADTHKPATLLSMKRKRGPVSVRSGQIEFVKLNIDKWQWRDAYQWLLGLTWPQFAAVVAAVYVSLNLLFAALYRLDPNSVTGMRTGSFWDAFF